MKILSAGQNANSTDEQNSAGDDHSVNTSVFQSKTGPLHVDIAVADAAVLENHAQGWL